MDVGVEEPGGSPEPTNPAVFRSGPLLGLLGGHPGGLRDMKVGEQRDYLGTVQSSMKLSKTVSVTTTVYAYKFECVNRVTANLAQDVLYTGGQAFEQEFMLEADLAKEAEKRIDVRRGNAAISVNFHRNDHSAVVSRLMSAVGRFSQYGVLSWEALSGGRDDVCNRDKVDGRIESGSDMIYVPRVTSKGGDSTAWYAVVGAALGCGNRVITDATATDINNRAMLAPPTGAKLAAGCIEALTIMANYYSRSGAGALFAWSAFHGANSEMSLVGVTDDGGYVRAALRRNRFVRPYGVIWLSGDRIGTLAVPPVVNRDSAARFFDSLLLYVAAGSAICDPTITFNGDVYPSIFSAGETVSSLANGQEMTDAEKEALALEHAKNISDSCGEYCNNMARLLDLMLMSSSQQVYLDKVSGFMQACFASKTITADRHLMNRVVAPYYWVEPTGVFGQEIEKYAAEQAGLGVFTFRGEERVLNCWEKIEMLGNSSNLFADFHVEFTAARKNPILMHLLNNSRDGLACMLPRQTREDGLALVGTHGTAGDWMARSSAGDDIETYLWRHNTSKTIAPAEFLQLHKGLSFQLILGEIESPNYRYRQLFQGEDSDMLGTLEMKAYHIQGLGIRKRSRPFNSEVNRDNRLAVAALNAHRTIQNRKGMMYSTMPISNSGSGPGLNQVKNLWQDPRRLIVTGEQPQDVWFKFKGKVQNTVVSHSLRHAPRSNRGPQLVQGLTTVGAGPRVEGGEQAVDPVMAESATQAAVNPDTGVSVFAPNDRQRQILQIVTRLEGTTMDERITALAVDSFLSVEEDGITASAAELARGAMNIYDDAGDIELTAATAFDFDAFPDRRTAARNMLYGPGILLLCAMAQLVDYYKAHYPWLRELDPSVDLTAIFHSNTGVELDAENVLLVLLAWQLEYEHDDDQRGARSDAPLWQFQRWYTEYGALNADDQASEMSRADDDSAGE